MRERASPITYAPMINESPIASNNPATIRDSPNASVATATGVRKNFSSREIQRANRIPRIVPPSQIPNAWIAIRLIVPQLTPPVEPAFSVPIIPMPTARTMMPSTSSITAPAMIVTPSAESIALRSERIRAVMPTEVAVHMIPMKSEAGCRKPIPAKCGRKCGIR